MNIKEDSAIQNGFSLSKKIEGTAHINRPKRHSNIFDSFQNIRSQLTNLYIQTTVEADSREKTLEGCDMVCE